MPDEADLKKTVKQIRMKAMDLLARREHTLYELTQKLIQREFDEALIAETLQQLKHENLQSDERFTEQYIKMRRGRGYGPERIQQELMEKGVAESLIAEHLNFADDAWLSMAVDVKQKKFGEGNIPEQYEERCKILKFLCYRGFTPSQANLALTQKRNHENE